jgi:hypothetical protein
MSGPVDPLTEPHRFDTEVIWTGMGPSAEMEALNVQQVLAASGIDAFVNGSSPIPSVQFDVLVARINVARAREVLAEAIAAGPEAAEQGERETELP